MRAIGTLLGWLMVVFFFCPAFSSDIVTEMKRLDSGLDAVRARAELPKLNVDPLGVYPWPEPIPQEAVAIFNRVQQFLFGRTDLIALKACPGCQAMADAGAMTVFLDVQFLKDLKSEYGDQFSDMITFIIAHELSHFTFDYTTLLSGDGLSPNGNIPLMIKSFYDFVDREAFRNLTQDQRNAEIDNFSRRGMGSHSEVDLLALMTLRKMGIDVVPAARTWLAKTVEKYKGLSGSATAVADLENRLKRLNEVMASGAAGLLSPSAAGSEVASCGTLWGR